MFVLPDKIPFVFGSLCTEKSFPLSLPRFKEGGSQGYVYSFHSGYHVSVLCLCCGQCLCRIAWLRLSWLNDELEQFTLNA